MSAYFELQITSNFSFLRGASHPEEYAEQAAVMNYEAVGLTDINTLAGVVRGHVAAKHAGVKLLVGSHLAFLAKNISGLPQAELPSTEAAQLDRREPEDDPVLLEGVERFSSWLPVSLILYPTDRAAYGRLSRLLTTGKLRAPKGECILALEDLEKIGPGVVGIAVVQDRKHAELVSILERFKSILEPGRLYLAASKSYGPDGIEAFEAALKLASKLKIPAVGVNNVYYHSPERRMLQDVLTCIRLRTTIDKAGFALQQNAERHLKSQEEMRRLFSRHPQLIEKTAEIYEQIKGFSLDQLSYEYPHEVCPEGTTPFEYLCKLTREGANDKYPPEKFPDGLPEKVRTQIRNELRLIRELKYEKYFLTCYDIVRFARSQGILCQGRGAAANSAVCFCLGITSVDPDRINLLFERFISKERNEPPDIDIDFEHERREEVIQYIYNRFGRLRAALVSEVISYRTKSSVRDTGKALGLPLETVELLLKAATRADDALPTETELVHYGLNPNDQRIQLTIELADNLRTFPRHLSQHVGGFVISETDLCEMVPIENASMPDRSVIEWDKDDVDRMGMLKIDCLGLGMLTCIRKAFDFVNERTKLPADLLKLHSIPAEDPAVYEMLCRADSVGVFQVESRAQMTMLPRLRPQCFYDLVIEVAIVRPGPIQGGMVHPFLRRRNNQEVVSYPDDRIKQILERTLGVPIFQEQVMELAVVAAGFTPGESDQLRRAIASWRKDKKALERFRARILEGMRRRGYRETFAQQLFEQIKGFGEYGFPQSHAASFALLVYVSSWLKYYHPAAFIAALINSQPMGFYQPAQLIEDAKRHGVEVRPIDINFSGWDCSLEYDHEEYGAGSAALRLGFRLIRSLHEAQGELVAKTVKERGRFSSLHELWKTSGCKVSTLRALARGDAFRSLGLTRQQAVWETARLRDGELPLLTLKNGKRPVDDEPESELPPISLPAQVVRDYHITGFSLKAHPVSFLRKSLERIGVITTQALRDERLMPAGYRVAVAVAGMVIVRQRPSTAKGTLFMTIEDESGMGNLILRETILKQFRDTIYDSTMVLACGTVQRQRSVVNVVVDEIRPIRYSALEEMEVASHDFR